MKSDMNDLQLAKHKQYRTSFIKFIRDHEYMFRLISQEEGAYIKAEIGHMITDTDRMITEIGHMITDTDRMITETDSMCLIL